MLLSDLDLSSKKHTIFCSLDAKGGFSNLKKHSLSKLLEIKEKLDLSDIWRVINPKKINILLGSIIFWI